MPARRSSLTSRSWKWPKRGSVRPLACRGGAGEDPVPIAVDGQGQAAGSGDLPEDEEVAPRVLLVTEDCAEYLPGRVIDGRVQNEAGTAGLQPVVVAALGLGRPPGAGA